MDHASNGKHVEFFSVITNVKIVWTHDYMRALIKVLDIKKLTYPDVNII